MKSLLARTTAALIVVGLAGVDANAHACPQTELVQSWYHRYLHRQPDPQGLHTWVSALRHGASPAEVQASILASEEYFCQHGHTNTGYVTGLFTDVLGRAPCAQELGGWLHRVRQIGCRKQLAMEVCATAGTAYRPAQPVVVAPAPPRHVHVAPVVATREAAPGAVLPPYSHGDRLSLTYRRR